MSRTVKTFRVKESETPPEPLPFDLEFIPADPEKEPIIESFEAFGKPPAGAQLALASVIRYGPRGRQNVDMNGMMEFFELVMATEDYERLRKLLDDPEWTIDIDLVGDIFTWLTEEYADRPTRRSRRSSHMRLAGGKTEQDAVIELPDDSVAETSST